MEEQRPASASKRPRMKRIFKNPNPLFMRWLSEWKREADEKESKMRHTYKICMQSLKQFPLPLTSGKSCAILKGFGAIICVRIDKKLEEYVQQHGSLPFSGGAEATESWDSRKINGASSKSPNRCVVQAGACHSGPGVAASTVLLALRTLHNSSCSQIQGWCKRDILSAAREVPTGSTSGTLDNPTLAGSTDPDRTLWNSVSALVRQDLVEKVPGKPVRYQLTTGGRSRADRLTNDQRCRASPRTAGLICHDPGRSPGRDPTDHDSPVTQTSAGTHRLSDSEPDSETDIRTERLTTDEPEYGGHSDDDLPDLATSTSQLSQPMGSTGLGHATPTLTSPPIGDDVIVVSSDSDCDVPVKTARLQEEWSAPRVNEQGGGANSHSGGVIHRDLPPPRLVHPRPERYPPPSRPVHPQSKRQRKLKADAPAGGSTFNNNRQEEADCSQLLAKITSIQSHNTAPYSSQSTGVSAPHSSQSAGVFAPHSSQSAGVSAPHSSQSAGVSAPHSSQSAGVSAPHSSQSAGVSAPHLSSSSAADVSSVDSQPLCRLAAGTFDIVLCVDTQETSGGVSEVNDRSRASRRRDVIISELQKSGLLTDIRRLSIGDFLWVARSRTDPQCDELVLPWVIERKRLDDLAASIRGSRYKEQKYRLQQCGLTNVVYLAEGMGTNKKQLGLPESSLQQALANCQAADGFLVQRTCDQRSTADYLISLTRSLCQQYQDMDLLGCRREDLAASTSLSTSLWTSFCQQQERLMTFSELQQRSSKRQRLNVSDTFARMLLQLHGLSTDKARAIVDAYPTPTLLAAAYRSCSSPAQGEALLSQLRCPRSKRPVGATISRALYNLYTSEELA